MTRRKYAAGMIGAIGLVASILGAGAHQATAFATTGTSYTFTTISNPTDPTFTQLLGINKAGTIAGYFGSGADAKHPNKGFTLGLPNTYTAENYPGSAQTQVIGINNQGDTDGFYVDSAGATHGFTEIKGAFATIDVPGTTFNQLLGLNNKGQQVGYYQFGPSTGTTFVPYIRQADGSFQLLPIANAQATGINDHGLATGFSNDKDGNSHGFLWQSGTIKTIDFRNAVSTQILGVNNLGQAVGSYTDSQKATHGFTYDTNTRTFSTVSVSASASTVVNGINRLGWLVGFYTDAKNNTIGFVAKPANR